jgi:hypothetical protein
MLFSTCILHSESERNEHVRLNFKFRGGKPRIAKTSVTLQRNPEFSLAYSYFYIYIFFTYFHSTVTQLETIEIIATHIYLIMTLINQTSIREYIKNSLNYGKNSFNLMLFRV